MKDQAYHFEIKDLITQFVAAFDNIIIKRYKADRSVDSSLQVRYVYSPKQRVMYDLVNLAQNITVPVVAVSIGSISRSADRVFNKINGFYYGKNSSGQYQPNSIHIRTPVPVDITVNMSILAKFQTDMDQILSNFIPYNNPYIIISWKVPSDFGISSDQEIRSEVLWNGSMAMSYPTDIAANAKYKITADTSFTIKGWLFPAASDPAGNIYYVNTNFYDTTSITDYESLTGNMFVYPTSAAVNNELETVGVSGNPINNTTRTNTIRWPISAAPGFYFEGLSTSPSAVSISWPYAALPPLWNITAVVNSGGQIVDAYSLLLINGSTRHLILNYDVWPPGDGAFRVTGVTNTSSQYVPVTLYSDVAIYGGV